MTDARDALERARRVTVDALVEQRVREHLPEREFERRVAAARSATSLGELRSLLADLPGSS